MKRYCLSSHRPKLKVVSCSGCSQPSEMCTGAGKWILHLQLLALPGASSPPAVRLEGLLQRKGQQSRCPQLCHVLQPPSRQELISLQGLLVRSSCCHAVSATSQCWLCLCRCLGIFSRRKTEARQDEEAWGVPAQGLMQGWLWENMIICGAWSCHWCV